MQSLNYKINPETCQIRMAEFKKLAQKFARPLRGTVKNGLKKPRNTWSSIVEEVRTYFKGNNVILLNTINGPFDKSGESGIFKTNNSSK